MSANGPPGVPKSLNEQYSWVQNTHLFRIAAEIKKLKETVKCGICHSTIQDHILTSCNHMFCAGCFKEFQKKTTSDRKNSCPVCAQKLNRRTFGSSEMVSTLIENYLKLAKHITGELFAFDIPADMRFFESQAVMTQMPLPRRSDPLPSPTSWNQSSKRRHFRPHPVLAQVKPYLVRCPLPCRGSSRFQSWRAKPVLPLTWVQFGGILVPKFMPGRVWKRNNVPLATNDSRITPNVSSSRRTNHSRDKVDTG
ncbi:hypothetical protein L596_018472 [Steinernema carpocapsae]|uniref:RING-type domain-containing protein n=1 Tax=Steinernema carpocapsae TaxID=34508 RepID=A0A4U5N5J7_STECR|nr:hypothetical protein L596_018472 [Steinernema carpocapsae]